MPAFSRRKALAGALSLAGMTVGGKSSGLAAAAPAWQMPEESGPHERTFMQWPVSTEVHDDPDFLAALQATIARIANAIGQFEPVVMLMDKAHQQRASKLLSGQVEVWDVATDDLWCRDSGPVFVREASGKLALTSVNFNGWGNKQLHGNDGQIARKIAERLGLELHDNGLVGEAGGVESDGAGTLLAHESCWVNPNRNAGSRAEVEQKLLEAFGASKMIWAPGVKGKDITDYHIDALARFVKPGTVLIQLPEKADAEDLWSVSAFETFEILRNATDAQGQKLELVKIPEPANSRVESADFVAAYVNYYVCNGAVIMPQFGDRDSDSEAQAIIEGLYPGREIVALNTDPVGEAGGGIHCATQQQPKGA